MKYNVIYNITLYLSAKKHFHIKYERKFYKTIAKEDDICSYDHRPTDWNAQTAAGSFLTTQRLEKESVRSMWSIFAPNDRTPLGRALQFQYHAFDWCPPRPNQCFHVNDLQDQQGAAQQDQDAEDIRRIQ